MIVEESPFRIFPTRPSEQRFASDQAVCGECLAGSCCSSEDPIYITAFDILRLSAFFDLSPAAFMLRFTQDRFEGAKYVVFSPGIHDLRLQLDLPVTQVVGPGNNQSRLCQPCEPAEFHAPGTGRTGRYFHLFHMHD